MNEKYYTLVTELVGHLAWPITVIVLVLIFRLPLKKLIEKLKKFGWGNKSIEFAETEKDQTKSNAVESALSNNDVKVLYSLIQQPELRLLLALAGNIPSLPLSIYHGPKYDYAKKNIIKLGLVNFQHGKFTLTQLGLKIVSKQIEGRIDLNEKLNNTKFQ